MITLARESRGLTQKELSELIPNANQGNLSKIERGQLNATKELLLSIAGVLSYPIGFFHQREVQTPTSNFYYRKRASVSKKVLSKFEARVNIFRKSIDKFFEYIEMNDFSFPKIEVSIHNTPKQAARAVREYLKIPKGPIKDLIKILEDAGIMVYFINVEDEGIDGLTAFTDAGKPIIFINDSFSNDRKRITLAHELGHLVMHIPFVLEDWRDEEKEAFEFASEFIMPEADCKADFYNFNFNKLTSLKQYWGFSKAAIIRKALEMSIITRETYTYMVIELGRRGERKKETGFAYLDEPRLLKEIVEMLVMQVGLVKQEIAQELNISIEEFEQVFLDRKERGLKMIRGNRVA